MGQPIKLVNPDGEPFTVYGRHEAAVYLAQGYTYEGTVVIQVNDLTKLGVSDAIIRRLTGLGLYTYQAVSDVSIAKLVNIPGVGQKTAEKLKATAAKLV